jgi:hypothetical protein
MHDDGGRTLDFILDNATKTNHGLCRYIRHVRGGQKDKCRSSQDAVILLVRKHGAVGTDILILNAQGCG